MVRNVRPGAREGRVRYIVRVTRNVERDHRVGEGDLLVWCHEGNSPTIEVVEAVGRDLVDGSIRLLAVGVADGQQFLRCEHWMAVSVAIAEDRYPPVWGDAQQIPCDQEEAAIAGSQ